MGTLKFVPGTNIVSQYQDFLSGDPNLNYSDEMRRADTYGTFDIDQLLAARPELQQSYEQALPYFKKFYDAQVAAGSPSRIPTFQMAQQRVAGPMGISQMGWAPPAQAGREHAESPEEIAWNWAYQNAINPDTPVVDPATYLRQWYSPDQSWWDVKGAPAVSQALTFASLFPGLNPLGALSKFLGNALGSQLVGKAATNALAAAAGGADPLQAAGMSMLGGLGGKALNAAGIPQSVFGQGATATGLNAAGNAVSLAPANNAIGGLGGIMGTNFNLGNVLAPALPGALLNNSAGTGAAAGAALGLLGNTNLGQSGNGLQDLLGSAVQGYLQNKMVGQQGGQGALAGAANSLYSNYIANGTNDDKLRALLGNIAGNFNIDTGSLGSILGGGGSTSTGNLGGDLESILKGKVQELLDKYLGNSGGIAGSPAYAYLAPDIMTLYKGYYDQLGGGSTNYNDAMKQQYDAARQLLDSEYAQKRGKLDEDLNRRGLYSSGIALDQQNTLNDQLMNALAQAAGNSALDVAKQQQDSDNQRASLAMQMAKQRQDQLAKIFSGSALPASYSSGTGATPPIAPAGTVYNSANDLFSALGLSGAAQPGASTAGAAGAASPGTVNLWSNEFAGGAPLTDGSADVSGTQPKNVLFQDLLEKGRSSPLFSYSGGNSGTYFR